VADRLAKRPSDSVSHLLVVLPLREPAAFGSREVLPRLVSLLYWLTGDIWTFAFRGDGVHHRPVQMTLGDTPRPVEVALWSGGLDSLAGVADRLNNDPATRFVLFGTGTSSQMEGAQARVAERFGRLFPGRLQLVQMPIRLSGSRSLPKNPASRARGFLFLVLGATCALLQGQDKLFVYENGVGALNLPYRASEVGLDHSRAVHPVSLRDAAALLSELVGRSFTFESPFQFRTKAAMCRALVGADLVDLAYRTISCDSRHRCPGRPSQCGYCSSCILRRQALAVNGIVDRTPYVTSRHPDGLSPSSGLHLLAMWRQVNLLRSLLDHRDGADRLLAQFGELAEAADAIAASRGIPRSTVMDQIVSMYREYVREWDEIANTFGVDLLPFDSANHTTVPQ
jgi:hypothetical protein